MSSDVVNPSQAGAVAPGPSSAQATQAAQARARAERLARFSRFDPGNEVLALDLAQSWHDAGDHAQALAVIDACVQAEPGTAASLSALRGRVLLAMGHWHEAAALHAAALDASPTRDEPPALSERVAQMFNLGYALLGQGDQPAQAVHWLGQSAQLAEQAAQSFDADTRARLHHHHALALLEAGQNTDARAALARARETAPDALEPLLTQATLALAASDDATAGVLARQALRAHATSARAWLLDAQVALSRADGEHALGSAVRALGLDPDLADAHLLAAQADLLLAQPRRARQRLLAAWPGLSTHAATMNAAGGAPLLALNLMGWACLADDDAAAAQAAFDQALQHTPDSVEAMTGLCSVARAERHAEQAAHWLTRARAAEPGHPLVQLLASDTRPPGSAPGALDGVWRQGLQQMLAQPGVEQSARRWQQRLREAAQATARTAPSAPATPAEPPAAG